MRASMDTLVGVPEFSGNHLAAPGGQGAGDRLRPFPFLSPSVKNVVDFG